MRDALKVGTYGVLLAAVFGVALNAGVAVLASPAFSDVPAGMKKAAEIEAKLTEGTAPSAVTSAGGPILAALSADKSDGPVDVSVSAFGPPPEGIAALTPFGDPAPFAEQAPFADLDAFDKRSANAKPFTEHSDPFGEARATEPVPRRVQLVELAREASGLVSEAELERLIAVLESTVNEKKAEAELRQAKEALQHVVAEFPRTEAAGTAREMLEQREEEITPVEAPR